MNFAVGGRYEHTKYWTSRLVQTMNEVQREVAFQVAFGHKTIAKDPAVDRTHDDSSPASRSWSTKEADRVREQIRECDRDLLIVETPDTDNAHLETLLDPFGHLLLITEKLESELVKDWFNVAETCSLTPVYHVVTDKSTDDFVYRTTDEGVIVVRVMKDGPVMDADNRYNKRTRDNLEKMSKDILRRAYIQA